MVSLRKRREGIALPHNVNPTPLALRFILAASRLFGPIGVYHLLSTALRDRNPSKQTWLELRHYARKGLEAFTLSRLRARKLRRCDESTSSERILSDEIF
jgi:hypothetical protein